MSVKSNRRTDVYTGDVPGSGPSVLFIEWFGRVLAFVGIIMLLLAVITMHRGKVVQRSAKAIVADFHTANDFFATRANFTSPTMVKEQLQTLAQILTDLNKQTIIDVELLGRALPSLTSLVNAGATDVRIAEDVKALGMMLQGVAIRLNSIAADANITVASVIALLTRTIDLVGQLNGQLVSVASKLAILPGTGPNARTPSG